MAKIIMLSVLVLIFSSTFGVCGTLPNVKNIDSLSNVIWERTLGDKNIAYYNELALPTPKSKELIVAGERSNNIGKKDGIWIWKLDDSGNKIVDINIKNIYFKKRVINLINIQSLAICDDNTTIIIIDSSDTISNIILKMNLNGDVLLSKSIESNKIISKVLLLSDNSILLIGEQNKHSFFMKVDSSGKEIFNKIFDRGQYGKFSDGVSTNDGGFMLIENVGKSKTFTTNTSELFVSKFSINGEKQNEKYLLGRYGNIAIGENGSFAIIYDKSSTSAQDIWIQKYDNNLMPIWDINVISTILGIEKFKISSTKNGNYVVAGLIAGNLKTFVSYIDSNGTQKWSYLSKVSDYGIGTDIICKEDGCYLLKSIPNLQTAESLVRKIKIIKFQPQEPQAETADRSATPTIQEAAY